MNKFHKPVLIIIAGPNGSGKTTITSRILKHEWLEDAEYINPDNIAQQKFGNWNSPNAILQAANYCADRREWCLGNGKSLIFETVMSAKDKIDFVVRAKKAGYFVRLFFISTENAAINAKRIAQRVMEGGHEVPIGKIISRYDKSIANCITLAPFVDRLYVYDNSVDGQEARLLFRLAEGKLVKQYEKIIPEWARLIYPQEI